MKSSSYIRDWCSGGPLLSTSRACPWRVGSPLLERSVIFVQGVKAMKEDTRDTDGFLRNVENQFTLNDVPGSVWVKILFCLLAGGVVCILMLAKIMGYTYKMCVHKVFRACDNWLQECTILLKRFSSWWLWNTYWEIFSKLHKSLAQRRCSAPSLAFPKTLSKPWSSVRDNGGCSISIEQCPFVLGLTSEDSELILHECVQLTQDLKTKERYLFLFSDMIIIAKLKSGMSFRLKHRVDLSEMMVFSCDEGEDEEEACAFHTTPKNALIFIWPYNGCIASFRSLEVKELWLDTLIWQIREVGGIEGITVPSTRVLMKVITGCNDPKGLNNSNMETLIGCHTEADAKKYQLWAAMVNADGICHVIESNKKRKAVISWPFTFRRGSTLSDSSVPPELKAPLFDQPLSIVCEDDSLPKPIHDILKILRIQGPVTEGVFRKAANEKARKELKEELNYGKMLDLKSKPVHLLAVVLKDYLRGIPHQLLSSDLYQEWLAALEKPSLEEKIEEMKCVAAKLPRPNWVLLQHLICVLHNISKTSAVNKMDANNLAVCIGPNMLIPPQDKSLSLETQKQLNDKVITLVEFFIDNCFDLFGDNVSDLLGTSEHDSLEDLDPAELTSHQNDSAYDSTDPEHEGQASTISDYQINQWTINTSSSEELQCSLDQDLDMSGSSVTRFINAISSMERRCSEPYIYPSQNSKEVSGQKLTRSHDDVTVHNNTACLTDVDLSKKVSERALYRKKMPKGLKVNTNYNAGVSDDLHNACSNCSLESSFSDCSVFTSSPLISPSSPKRAGLLRHQSCSMKCKARSDTTPTGKEIKKHSKSFSYGNHKKMLTKTQSWGPEGEKAGLQRNEFSSGLRNKSGHEYDGTQNKPFQQPAVVRLRQPQSARKLSVDEVFRMVDQRNPGKPPSYEEAIHKNVLSHISMTVQTMRASISSKDCSTPNSTNEHIMDSSYRDDKRHSGNHQNSVNGTQTPEPCVEAAETIYQGGKPKATIVRTMSGFIQKNKHEYINRRCSQPLEIYDQIQYAKESYV